VLTWSLNGVWDSLWWWHFGEKSTLFLWIFRDNCKTVGDY
jgi:hypothetical protein